MVETQPPKMRLSTSMASPAKEAAPSIADKDSTTNIWIRVLWSEVIPTMYTLDKTGGSSAWTVAMGTSRWKSAPFKERKMYWPTWTQNVAVRIIDCRARRQEPPCSTTNGVARFSHEHYS
ncbi:hypothetical protein H310_13419 [Aphanomyces invadans]|uniref:Uncharacterized protein n=1 Tax=Aphanomyces invadans TaxID=157072 RepID=A0A024TFN5_9STRA|nr:hypothetical protein H310_13419 [Aphanomyces invadans]ETV92172.1 hypothetical protein H310_13419 [Aphanomyces invadans]|eukprot:XP_008879136.1 hypothetical protein H310_13419 [Aphanomyces invadans]